MPKKMPKKLTLKQSVVCEEVLKARDRIRQHRAAYLCDVMGHILEGTKFSVFSVEHYPVSYGCAAKIQIEDSSSFCTLTLDLSTHRAEVVSQYPNFVIEMFDPTDEVQLVKLREHILDVHYSLMLDFPDEWMPPS